MPIGKNSIKRVENAGYSKVETSAPDMENSTVEASPEAKPAKKTGKKPESKKPSAKKQGSKKAPPKKGEAKKPIEKKPTVKRAEKKDESRDGFIKYSFGEDLPTYLL
jgi:hypothetical protein